MTRRAYIDGPYGQIHVRSAGEGGIPLLLLHQSPLTGAMFCAAMSRLADAGVYAVAMDTPGYGLSDGPKAPVSISDYAAAIPSVLDALGWQKAHILGHHTGAMISAAFAARHPERLTSLVLNGSPLLSDEDRAHFSGFRFAPLDLKPDGSHLIAAWAQRLAASPGWSDLPAMHRFVVDRLANPDIGHFGFEAAFAHDHKADLLALTVPTLILTNSGEDLYEASLRASALRPDFSFVALDGGTHDIIDEQPEAWTRVVVEWVRKPS